MTYFYRLLWALFYIPVFLLEILLFLLALFTYPIVGGFYFIKTGDVENIPYIPDEVGPWIDKIYRNLLLK